MNLCLFISGTYENSGGSQSIFSLNNTMKRSPREALKYYKPYYERSPQ